MEHATLPQSHDISNTKTEKLETQTVIESSENEVVTNKSSECGEFILNLVSGETFVLPILLV